MNRISTLAKYLFLLAVLITSVDSYAQCNTEIRAVRDTIACGESLLLTNIPPMSPTGTSFSSGSLDPTFWDLGLSTLTGMVGTPPGCVQYGLQCIYPAPPAPLFWFTGGAAGNITTQPLNISCPGTISFDYRQETQGINTFSPCDGPDEPSEGMYFQYSLTGLAGSWVTIYYFIPMFVQPANPLWNQYPLIGISYACWDTYSFTIPAGAIGANTRFRWYTTNTSSAFWDQWGMDNISISLDPPCGNPFITSFFGPNIPTPYNLDTITITPYTDSAIYSVYVTDGTISCTDSFTVYVEQPSIVSQLFPAFCTGSDTLYAQATIIANCDYTLELLNYNPSGATTGWSTGGASPMIYHNLNVNVDGSLFSNFTMTTGAHGASISFPIAVTDGDLLETYFTSLGSSANECVYRIYDSQGIVANTGMVNPAYTGIGAVPLNTYFNAHLVFNIVGGAGYNSAPWNPGNPAPIITLTGGGCTIDTIYVNNVTFGTGVITSIQSYYNGILFGATGCTSAPNVTVTGGGGAGAIITAILVDDAIHVTCPTIATYNYSWTNITSGGGAGLSNPNIQNPLATVAVLTDFQVTAYDPLHPLCFAIDTVPVSPNSNAITATFSGPTAICEGDPVVLSFLPMVGQVNWDLSLDINGNNNTYTLDGSGNDISTGLPLTFYPTTTTTYDVVTLLDFTGCPATIPNPSLTVTVIPMPNAGTSANITVCETDPFFDLYSILTGSPDLGGTWTNSAGTVLGSSFYNPAASTSDNFTYTVSGISPCNNDFAIVSVINNAMPDAGQNAAHPVCETDAAFDMYNFLGGTPQTGGSWTNASGGSVGNMFDPSTMSSGVFTYTVPGLFPCLSGSANLDVTVNPLPTALISTTTPTICTGNSATIDFTFTGTAPFDVTYNDGTSNSTQTINSTTGSIVVSPTVTTTYSLVDISDANLCTQTVSGSSITVTVNALPTVTASSNPVSPLCDGDLLTLTGGGATTYVWDNGVVDNIAFTPAVGTVIYTVTGTDVNSCFDIATISVTVNALPTVTASSNPVSPLCDGDLLTLTGSGTTSYLWDNGVVDNIAFTPAVGTVTYTVTGTDVNSCSDIATIPITVNALPTVTASSNPVSPLCDGDLLTLTGSGATSYLWDNGVVDNTAFIPAVGTVIYTVTGTDVNSCSDIATISITVNALPTVIISGTTTITQGMSTLIDFTFTGSAPFTVIYDDGTGPITSPSFPLSTGTINVSPNATTIYTLVSVTDANGCVTNNNSFVTITVNQLPTVMLSGTASICVGGNTPLNFTLGGSPNFTVEYNVNGVLNSYVFNSTGSNLLNVSPTITTTYTIVSITDGNGVIVNNISSSVTITVNQLPTAVLSGDFTICVGGQTPLNFVLTGDADYSLTYNPGGVTVTLNASGNDATTGNPVMVNPSSYTIYSIVSVTDANGCNNIGSGTATITVNPLPTISIGGTTPICAGQSSNLSFTLSGTAPYNVNYLVGGSPANVTLDAAGTVGGTPLSVTPNNTTTYTLVDVTDYNSCIATSNASITIVVNPLPTATISGSTSICDGKSTALDLNFTGTGPYNINYDVDDGTSITNTSAMLNNNVDSIPVNPSVTTTYTLIDVTDSYCFKTATGMVIVTVNPLPSASISGDTTICADGSTVPIDIIIASGTSPFNVIYSDGFNNATLNGISSPYNFQTNTAGNYTLSSVIDFKGCSGNVSGVATIVVNLLPVANFSFMPQPIDINNPTIYFTDKATGHIAGIYDFGDGTTAPSVLMGKQQHTYLDTGSYQVLYTVTSIDGCTHDISRTIIIDPAFLIYIPTAFTPNRDGKNDIFIPIMMGIDEYNLYIYDRYGGLIFETEDQLEGWNGRTHGNEFALEGHYAYAIHIVDLLGKKRTLNGTLTLIR